MNNQIQPIASTVMQNFPHDDCRSVLPAISSQQLIVGAAAVGALATVGLATRKLGSKVLSLKSWGVINNPFYKSDTTKAHIRVSIVIATIAAVIAALSISPHPFSVTATFALMARGEICDTTAAILGVATRILMGIGDTATELLGYTPLFQGKEFSKKLRDVAAVPSPLFGSCYSTFNLGFKFTDELFDIVTSYLDSA